MKNIRHIRHCFVRQVTENDCGVACLGMILNYTGRKPEINKLRSRTIETNGLTLLDLKNLVLEVGIQAKCVEMNINFLRSISTPVILHTENDAGMNHFQVCYGAVKRRNGYAYLMSDPARQVYYLPEDQLEKVWVSHAAIYFDGLLQKASLETKSPWSFYLTANYFPKGLYIAIPFINLCSVTLGAGISWVLQKGINDSLAGKKDSLIAGVIFLLLIITMSRSLFAFVKQRILIILNNMVNEKLFISLIKNNERRSDGGGDNIKLIKNNLAEIQKIQNGLSVFVSTLLSDGSLILLLLSASFYTLVLSGLFNGIYIVLVIMLTVIRLPQNSFDYAHLDQLGGITEHYLSKEPLIAENSKELSEARIKFHEENHKRYLKFARSIAYRISKMNLVFECLGTVNVIITLCLALVQLQQQLISYGTFMLLVILSYLITSLMPKIAAAISIVSEGAEIAAHFTSKYSNVKG